MNESANAAPSVPANSARLLLAVTRKELLEVARDGRFWMVGLVVAALSVVALSFGFRHSARVAAERAEAQRAADTHFVEQDEKNPHVAAHYGTHVFKPGGALPFFDPGVDPFVGASIKLEAHRRNALQGAAARDGTSLSRFGRLSVASVLQLFVPLLIIGLGFSAWTAERERGTLRLLATTGVSLTQLWLGKTLGLCAALLALLLPAVLLGGLVVVVLGPDGAPVGRAVALALAYAAYFWVFLCLTLGVSALARTSRGALVLLLGAWVGSALVVPRAAADVAALVSPAPTAAALEQTIKAGVERGIPGGPTRDARVAELTEAMLAEQGFAGAETLMDAALLNGIELIAEAKFENEVIDHVYGRWKDAIAKQERIVQWASLISPPVALRTMSMAFAGTDTAHHRHFADAAERHRRALIDMLNRELVDKGGADVWSFRAGRETWERAPRFEYRQPSLDGALREVSVSVVILLAWAVFATTLAWRAAQRVKVI